MSALKGRRVALLEARLTQEASDLVDRFGGRAYPVPAVREVVHPDRIRGFIHELTSGKLSIVVFLTGAGVTALFREADSLGALEPTLAALRRTTIACRGPKPTSVLDQHAVPVHIAAAEPYTTKELIDALASIDVSGRTVALVRYGEPNRALAAALVDRGARLEELSLYEWMLPVDRAPLEGLVRDLVAGEVDAVAFTNEIQCRHLFQVARDLGLSDRLAAALNGDVVVAAVGPVCAAALHALGVVPDVLPAKPRMAATIAALADYFELTEGLSDEPDPL